MLWIIGFIFMIAASVCFALGTIFDYLGAAKDTDEFKEDETVVEDTETTEEATEEE